MQIPIVIEGACNGSWFDALQCWQVPIAAGIGGGLAVITAIIAYRAARRSADKNAEALRAAAEKNFDAARLGAEAAQRAAEIVANEAAADRRVEQADRRHRALFALRAELAEYRQTQTDLFFSHKHLVDEIAKYTKNAILKAGGPIIDLS